MFKIIFSLPIFFFLFLRVIDVNDLIYLNKDRHIQTFRKIYRYVRINNYDNVDRISQIYGKGESVGLQ